MSIDWDTLVAAAWRVRERAYAPYSSYLVGAALLADDGRTFVGANVENASYGLCLCAERSAIGAAVAAGSRRFVAIAIVTGGAQPGTPCGMCRQVLAEFGPSFDVRCVAESGATIASTTAALLPLAFTPLALGVDPSNDPSRSTLVMGTTGERARARAGGASSRATSAFGAELAQADVTQIEGDVDDEGRK